MAKKILQISLCRIKMVEDCWVKGESHRQREERGNDGGILSERRVSLVCCVCLQMNLINQKAYCVLLTKQ